MPFNDPAAGLWINRHQTADERKQSFMSNTTDSIPGRFVRLYCSLGWDDSCAPWVRAAARSYNARNDGYHMSYDQLW